MSKIQKFQQIQILEIEIKTWSGRLQKKGISGETAAAIVAKIRPMVEERVGLMQELGLAPAGM